MTDILQITKIADKAYAKAGETINYIFILKNNSETLSITDITLLDDVLGDLTSLVDPDTLTAGETRIINKEYVITATTKNTAIVSGTYDSDPVHASATCCVIVGNCCIPPCTVDYAVNEINALAGTFAFLNFLQTQIGSNITLMRASIKDPNKE
jgi:uncharacterized repeat protein (TIGR01451 family)